ncbi:hybrid sensor histidine kinase/response regulator [Vitreimonas flagellata]|uniref:ATP-binding response regulator n=1 Tax=Vitreimonas flagellata TaxID=2560861 RepID=UPI001074BC20|nr:hybrid sensor histidine kinase/response regulator [Vitreimonas flagellata]
MQPDRLDALGPRRSRAEFLLMGAIALVALLVFAVLAEFGQQRHLHQRTIETVAISRNMRSDTLAIMQSLTDVKAARLLQETYNSTDVRLQADAAAADVRAQIELLQQQAAIDPELEATSARIAALIEADLSPQPNLRPAEIAVRSTSFRAELRTEITRLLTRANAINDAAREEERRSRERLDATTIALGVLALVAAALGALAVRGERARWRLARDAAEAARAAAAEADAAKTRFLAVASHDMRQPLHALTLYLTALERRVETTEARDILTKMERATQSMVGMFGTLLDLARVQSGAITPEFAPTPLQPIIDRIIAEHPGRTIEAAPTTLSIETDETLFERALSNLVVNAMKHGGGAARIEIATSGQAVDISVIDNGPGIAREDQERMFEEFVRLERSKGDGLGLGLAIVRRISNLLNMPLRLDSAPGHGARFTLRARRANGAATQNGEVASRGVAGANVLLLDDDMLAREAVAGTLRDLGAMVQACANEAEINLALQTGFRADLLVMDLRIDGALQGLDITRRVRARFDPPPPAIMITGDTDPDTLTQLRASGFGWLIKPIDADALSALASTQLANTT